jgi:hypothetical protein
MHILLHEGHQHTETATSALSPVSPTLIAAAVVAALLGVLLLGYTIKQRRG